MAFVSGMRPSSSNGLANGMGDQQAQSQDFRAALQQQLLAMQQQQQQQPPPHAVAQQTPQVPSGMPTSQLTAAGNNLLYQQLLAQQLQPSLNQPPQLPTQTQQPNPQLALHQQIAALQNLQNPSAMLQQQFPNGSLGQLGQTAAPNNNVATIAALIAANPALLQALAGTATSPTTISLIMQLLMSNAASSLIQPQQQNLLSLLQLLTNPTSALLNYPPLLQQPPLQQPQITQPVNQIAALTHLLLGNSANNANLHQLTAALSGSVPGPTNSTDENRAYLDQLLRQVQEQQHQQQQAQQQTPIQASNTNTPRLLSAQNSSNSLMGTVQQQQQQQQQQHSNSTSNNSLTSTNSAAREAAAPQQVQMMDTSGPLSSTESANYPRTNERQPSSERLLNAESVQDHITRLINENEAIVEPNPVLLKRRPYNRTNTSNSIASQSSVNDNGSQRGSPSIRSPGLQTRVPTTRSQSLHEASMLNTFRAVGSLTSGQPVFRPTDQRYPHQASSLTCNFCGLKFPNEAGLEAHEFRCSKKEQLTKQHSQPQLQLSSISSQTHAQQQAQLQAQLLMLQQQKLMNAQQSNASAFMASTHGIMTDAMGGRSSAPDSPSGTGAHKLGFQPVHSSSPSSSERSHPLKKRLLEAAAKEVEIVDVVSINNEPQTSAKMPKMEPSYAESIEPHNSIQLFQNERVLKEEIGGQSQLFDQPTSSNADPDAALLRQLAAQQELVAKRAREIVEQQQQAKQQQQQQQEACTPPASATSACPKGMRDTISTALLYIEAKVSDKMPYVVTLSEQITAALKNEGAPPTALCATPYRNRMRNITQDTFVCLHRPQPMFVLQKKNLSMYSNWQQVQVSSQEVSLIHMYFKTYSTKPRMGTKELYRFTLANKDRNQLRLTHSTFWMLLNKHRMQMTYEEQQQANNAIENFQTLDDATPSTIDGLQTLVQKPETPLLPSENTFLNPTRELGSSLQLNQNNRHENSLTIAKSTKGMTLTGALAASKIKSLSGGRVDEVDVYIRGRGRGRYVCERCGIRCKKPSMLKKHLRSHTNIRPFSCNTCNFSFKTKGNLTKHLCSKAHRRRLAEKNMGGGDENNDSIGDSDENRLVIDNNDDEDDNLNIWESKFMDDEDKRDEEDESDNDEDVEIEAPQPFTAANNINYRRFGQENILVERSVHTPPSIWMRNLYGAHEDLASGWSTPDIERNCNSAPAVVEVAHSVRKPKVPILPSTASQRFASISSSSLNMNILEQKEALNIQQNFLISDISPPASADAHSSAMNPSNTLIANFIPLSKQPTEAEKTEKLMASAFYFLQAASSSSASFNDLPSGSISNEDASKFDLKKISSASMEAFLASEAQDLVCDMCEKKFRKESELLLHKQTHLIERQQNARARTYQCSECKITMRSKLHLSKHIETVHAGASIVIDDEQSSTSASNPNNTAAGSTFHSSTTTLGQILLSTSSSSARSFVCKDCNLGFRTHGVLAKHLRSKNHVKTLSSLGKLPDDAINLIKENSNVLANVDATDSEIAYESLFQIIANLRNATSQTTTAAPPSVVNQTHNDNENSSSSLECREQLGAQSPGPQTPNGYKFNLNGPTTTSGYSKNFSQFPVGIKRKNERPSPGEPQSPPARRPRCNTGQRAAIESLIQRASHEATLAAHHLTSQPSGYTSPDNAVSPLHSLANIATATANRSTSSPSVGNVKTIAANVWIPPRFDQLDRKTVTPDSNGMSNMTKIFLEAAAVSENIASSRSTEENSEGRSEASTPVQRASVNGIIAASPLSQATKCNVCELNFDTPCELQVHLHADHIIMRDGREFKCPKRHCEKVYPTRENLRAHIIAHYYGGGATPTFDGREDNDYAPSNHIASSPSELISGSPQTLKKPSSVAQNQPAASIVPNNSPDAPEESNTAQKLGMIGNGMRAPMFSTRNNGLEQPHHLRPSDPTAVYNVLRQSPQLVRPKSSSSDVVHSSDNRKNSIPCAMCAQIFADAAQLQCHWVSDHMTQMNSRPFVCKECDAGFPSKFQLDAHIATHSR